MFVISMVVSDLRGEDVIRIRVGGQAEATTSDSGALGADLRRLAEGAAHVAECVVGGQRIQVCPLGTVFHLDGRASALLVRTLDEPSPAQAYAPREEERDISAGSAARHCPDLDHLFDVGDLDDGRDGDGLFP